MFFKYKCNFFSLFLQFQKPARVCVPSINKESKTDDSDEIQILSENKVVDAQVKKFNSFFKTAIENQNYTILMKL